MKVTGQNRSTRGKTCPSATLSTTNPTCYLVPLRPEYPPQHPILEHPQPTFLTQCERPGLTPKKNKRQNYSSVYLNLYIVGQQNWKAKYSAPNNSKHSLSSVCSQFLHQCNFSICWGCFQIFELFHPFKGLIIYIFML
jgi:hypothetical protein